MKANRKYKLAIWGIIIGGTAAATALLLFVFGSIFPNGISFLLFAAMVFGAVFLALHIGKIISYRYMDKITAILEHECDPELYLSKIRALMEKPEGKGRLSYNLYLSYGSMCKGEYEEAKAILENVVQFPDDKTGKMLRASYKQYLFNIYFAQGDTGKAECIFSEFSKIISTAGHLSKKYKNSFDKATSTGHTLIQMEKGNFEGAEQVFNNAFHEAKSKLGKVNYMYRLGKIYAHLQRYDEALKAFNYVIENGNKLHVVTLAREQLAKIG